MDYKILVLDVDGTLLNSKHEISKRTRAALVKAQQAGMRIVLSSGRPLHGLLPIMQQLELSVYGGYAIAYNGSQIIDAKNNEVMFERRVNPETMPYLEKKSRKNNFAIFTYDGKHLITDTPTDTHVQEEARLNNLEVVYEPEFSISVDFMPCKIVLSSDDKKALSELADKWKRNLNGSLEIHQSEDFFLEVLPYGVDKSAALSVLLDYLKVDAKNVIAFGDGIRDVGVLQMVGQGIAMGNARDSVKACVDSITESNDKDGVAIAIEKMLETEIRNNMIPLDVFNKQSESSLMGNLGISYTYVSASRIEATMPVDHRTRQPFGILHGGASLALAETVAGLGSMVLAKVDETVVGMQVSGNHISSAHEGDTVRAVATIVHAGRSSHIWDVEIFTSTGKLVNTTRVVNSIIKKHS